MAYRIYSGVGWRSSDWAQESRHDYRIGQSKQETTTTTKTIITGTTNTTSTTTVFTRTQTVVISVIINICYLLRNVSSISERVFILTQFSEHWRKLFAFCSVSQVYINMGKQKTCLLRQHYMIFFPKGGIYVQLKIYSNQRIHIFENSLWQTTWL